jgi:hypothetical protein
MEYFQLSLRVTLHRLLLFSCLHFQQDAEDAEAARDGSSLSSEFT